MKNWAAITLALLLLIKASLAHFSHISQTFSRHNTASLISFRHTGHIKSSGTVMFFSILVTLTLASKSTEILKSEVAIASLLRQTKQTKFLSKNNNKIAGIAESVKHKKGRILWF
jgi:hypothetical protein